MNLNLLNCNNQLNAIEQIDIEAEQELAEIEAEAQKRKAAVENRRNARITRINLLRENAIFIQTGSHKNIYPTPEGLEILGQNRSDQRSRNFGTSS